MPVTFDDDPLLFPHLPGMLTELASVLEDLRIPTPCTMTPAPGELLSMDYLSDDCESLGWARISGAYPSTVFPNQDPTVQRMLILATTVELGIVRTIPVPANGEPMDTDQLYEVTRAQLADQRAILQALCQYGAKQEDRIVIGNYVPIGPAGAIAGGYWTATLPQAI